MNPGHTAVTWTLWRLTSCDKRFRELDDERLGGRVERVSGGRGHEPGQRRHVDDASVAALDHAGQQPMRQLGEAGHHHLQHGVVPLPWRGDVRAGHAVAGVVDERVDGEPARRDLGAQPGGRVAQRVVRDDHEHARLIALLEPGRHRAEAVLPAGGDDEVEAVGGKHLGKGLADAGRGAGDQSGSRVHAGCSSRVHARCTS